MRCMVCNSNKRIHGLDQKRLALGQVVSSTNDTTETERPEVVEISIKGGNSLDTVDAAGPCLPTTD